MNIEKWKLEQKWVNETGVWFRWNYCNGKFDWDWNHQRCTSPRCTVVLLLDCQILYLAIFSFCVLDKTLEIMPEPCQVANEWGPLRIYIPLSFYSCPTCFFFFFFSNYYMYINNIHWGDTYEYPLLWMIYLIENFLCIDFILLFLLYFSIKML